MPFTDRLYKLFQYTTKPTNNIKMYFINKMFIKIGIDININEISNEYKQTIIFIYFII